MLAALTCLEDSDDWMEKNAPEMTLVATCDETETLPTGTFAGTGATSLAEVREAKLRGIPLLRALLRHLKVAVG